MYVPRRRLILSPATASTPISRIPHMPTQSNTMTMLRAMSYIFPGPKILYNTQTSAMLRRSLYIYKYLAQDIFNVASTCYYVALLHTEIKVA